MTRVGIAGNQRYFQLEDANGRVRPFFPSGHNFLSAPKDDQDVAFAASLGENVLRIWPDAGMTGRYDEQRLDLIFDAAAKHGLWLICTVFDAGPLTDLYSGRCRFLASGDTMFNPVCERPEDVFTNPAALETLKERLGFFLERWGSRDNIMAWEFNQMDGVYSAPEEAVTEWTTKVIAFLREWDEKKLGRARLVGVSSFDPFPSWDLFYNGAGVDFLAGHAYTDSVKSPVNSVDGAVHTGLGCRYALSRSRKPKPYLDTESGPMAHVFDWVLPRPPQTLIDELFGNMVWVHVAAGGAGHSITIPVSDRELRHPASGRRGSVIWNRLSPGQAQRLKALLAAVDGIDWVAWDPVDAATGGLVWAEPWEGWLFATSDRLTGETVGFLLQDTRKADAASTLRAAMEESGPCGPDDYNRRLFALDVWMWMARHVNLELTSYFTREQLGVIVRKTGQDNTIYPVACVKVDEILRKMKDVTRWDAALGKALEATAERVSPSLSFRGYPVGSYELTWVAPDSGQAVRTDRFTGPGADLKAPSFGRGLGFRIRRKPA